jgi:hypothetical protein
MKPAGRNYQRRTSGLDPRLRLIVAETLEQIPEESHNLVEFPES